MGGNHLLLQNKFVMLSIITTMVLGSGGIVLANNQAGSARDMASDDAIDSSDTATVSDLGLFGGNIWDTAVDAATGRVYAVAKDSPNGFYWSDDKGDNWNGLGADVDFGGSVAVEVNQADGTVFVTFSNGLYRSTDLGETFTSILEDSSETLLSAQDQIMLASSTTPGNIEFSADNGDSFTSVTVDSSVTIWWIADGVTPGTFYAVGFADDGTEHVYRSTTGGSSWSEMTIPTISDSSYGGRVCVNATDATNVFLSGGYNDSSYYSTNSGTSWTAAPDGVASQTCVSDDTGRVYIGGSYTDNKGTDWGAVADDNDLTETAVGGHGLTIDPNDASTLYADGMPGLSKSTDHGASWTDINTGIRGVTTSGISQATNKDIVWVAAYNGVAKTTNFTSSEPSWDFPVLQEPAQSVWVQPDNPDVVVVGELGAIKRSIDGGTTWSDNLAPSAVTNDFVVSQIIQDNGDANTIYAAVAFNQPGGTETGMVYESTDAGLTWTDLEVGDNASAQTISQASSGDLFVGVGSALGNDDLTGIYKYHSGTWIHLSESPATEIVKIIVDPGDDNRIYAIASHAYGNGDSTNFGFYLSIDSGGTWDKITTGLDDFREFDSLTLQSSTSPNTLYLGVVTFESGRAALYKSSDAGDSWGLVYTGLRNETFYTMLFDGVTVGSSRGLFEVTSKAKINLKHTSSGLTLTLKDAATNNRLKHKRVKILRKENGSYVVWKTVRTHANGKATLDVSVKAGKTKRFKARWTPNSTDSNEYTRATSTVVKIHG